MPALKRMFSKPCICTCCLRHTILQLAEYRTFRVLGIAALAADLWITYKLGWLHF